ncbi:hypothetical protein [Phocoenobacter uteri]|uniref:hypothetical protein n=1 Tax=Phocoenobacter uteri TaxID=146806 RepID=UPI0015599624|nr:hypothetical protein [Phocoenobacter uteri]
MLIPTVIALFIAYAKLDEKNKTIYDNHLDYLIRTFLIVFCMAFLIFIYFCITILLSLQSLYVDNYWENFLLSLPIFITPVFTISCVLWCIIRILNGMIKLYKQKDINPMTWFI